MEAPLLADACPKSVASLKAEVSQLPDLTDKLKEHGIHEEYVAFREGYMRWRKGEASGAKGQLDDLVKRAKEFEHWYPTVGTFNFRRTISFWAGALTAEGSLLFLWVALFDEYGKTHPDLMYWLTKLPSLLGGTAYLAGIYFNYYELINLETDIDSDKRNFLWCDWKALLGRGIEVASIVASSLYLVGALCYSFAQISDLFNVAGDLKAQLVDWPYIVGGFLFFVSGLCELLINRVYKSLPITLVWWVSVVNCIGGYCFWVSACPSMFAGEEAILVGALGDASYLLGGLLTLLMWRGEQFGNALIPALNFATREATTNIVVQKDLKTGVYRIIAAPSSNAARTDGDPLGEVLTQRLSRKGVLFLFFYILIGVIQMVVACASMAQTWRFWNGPQIRKLISQFVSDMCNVTMVHMILLLHSACASLPKKNEQPYRSLFILMRILSVIYVGNSILALEVVLELDVH